MHVDAPIKSRDKSLWVPTTVWHTYTEAHQRGAVGGEVETAEIILFIAAAAAAAAENNLPPAEKRPFDLRFILIWINLNLNRDLSI